MAYTKAERTALSGAPPYSSQEDVGSFFDNVNKTGDYNLVLQDKKLQGTTNTVKKFNVAKDEYTH